MEFRKKALVVAVAAVLGGTAVPLTTVAQETDDDSDDASSPSEVITDDDSSTVDKMVVTGSRIQQREGFSVAPVTTVNRENFDLSGTINTESLINTLPQFSGRGGRTGASIDQGSAAGTVPLSMRGLGPNRNLLMVNSRRWMIFDSSLVSDLNTIPAALIERVDVVSGGASAVYGSDAIAGAVNFILKEDFEGVEINGLINSDSRGDAVANDFTVTAGTNFGGGRGNVTFSVNYLNRPNILQFERGFSANVLFDGVDEQGNPTLVQGGSATVPNGRFSGIPFNNPSPGLESALDAAGLGDLGSFGFIMSDDGSSQRPFESPDDIFNYAFGQFLQLPQERWQIHNSAQYDFNNSMTGYAEATFSHNEVIQGFSPNFFVQQLQFETDNPFISDELRGVFNELDMIDSSPNDGLITLSTNRRLLELGGRRQTDKRNAWRTVFGLRGELGDFTENVLTRMSYDVYYSFARTENTATQTGNISIPRFRSAVLSDEFSSPESSAANGAPLLNPFGRNTISQEALDFISVNSINNDNTELEVAAGNLSGTLFSLPAGPVGMAVGGEWRSASNSFISDPLQAQGDVSGFTPIASTSGSIDVWELFGEVRVPFLSDLPLVQALDGSSGFRFSDYNLDGVGSVWTYFAGVNWRVNNSLGLRAQFQRAIRAPNVGEAFGGQTQSLLPADDPCADADAATDPVKRDLCLATGVPEFLLGDPALQINPQVIGIGGGNENLDAEQSNSWTAGIVYRPDFASSNATITLDYFLIELTDAIAPLAGGAPNILDLCFNVVQNINSAVCRAVNRNPSTGDLFSDVGFVETAQSNIGKIETSGLDLGIQYRYMVNFGLLSDRSDLDLEFNGTWTDKLDVTPLIDLADRVNKCAGLFGATCGDPTPEFKTTTRLTWRTGPLDLSLRHRWIDQTKADIVGVPRRRGESAPSFDSLAVPSVGGEQYVDLSFSYRLGEQISIRGGANNVFDNDPPLAGTAQDRANTFEDTFETIGTEIYLGFTFKY